MRQLLSFQDLQSRGIPYSRQWIYHLVEAGKFPRPIKVGTRRIAWVGAEIEQWIEECTAERDRGAA